uniref:Secreted protein n=1 Tax=Ixodes ricinus TaxID=34613 RepID=V5GKQ8_IXORI
MRLAILTATLFIVGVADKKVDDQIIFDLTKCVKKILDYEVRRGKTSRTHLNVTFRLLASFQKSFAREEHLLKIKLGNITYGTRVHSKNIRRKYQTILNILLKPTKEPQPGYYMSSVRAPIAAIWNFNSVFKSEFTLVTSTEPPKVYNGSQEKIYEFDFNDTLRLGTQGITLNQY